MFEFLVGLVLIGLVAVVIVASTVFRNTVLCRRRDRLVRIVDGQCEYRTTLCANAPIGCEGECVRLSHSAAA